MSILKKAETITSKARQKAYGHPKENFSTIAQMWNAYLERKYGISPIAPEDVGMLMILTKVAREANSHNQDNLIDIAGYAKTVDQCHE